MVHTGMKLERASLVDQAVEQLRAEIVDGVLPPGTSLPEGAISEKFGIARPTVREVLLRLQNDGLVQRQGRGQSLAVTRIDREQVRDIYIARIHLEVAGARSYDTATDRAREAIDKSLDELETSIKASDTMEQIRRDSECHTAVVALTGSKRLVAVHTQVLMEARLASVTTGGIDRSATLDNHRDFVGLLKAGEIEAATRQLQYRLNSALDRVLQNLRS